MATDSTACRSMGFDPHEIGHIRMAHEKGLGEIDDIEILGESIGDVRRVFERL